MRSADFMICSLPFACSDVDSAICCTVSAIRRDRARHLLPGPWSAPTSPVAIACTIKVDLLADSKILPARLPAPWLSPHAFAKPFCTPCSITDTAFFDSSCTPLMSAAISLVELPVRSARSLISSATTAKPRPCSPACAAMIAAFNARKQIGLLGDVVDDVQDVADFLNLVAEVVDDLRCGA